MWLISFSEAVMAKIPAIQCNCMEDKCICMHLSISMQLHQFTADLPVIGIGTRRAKHPKPVNPCRQKYSTLPKFGFVAYIPPSRPCQRGASRSSRDAGRGAVDAVAPARLRRDRDG